MAATGDAKQLRDLWERACGALSLQDPDLGAIYERHLAPTVANPSLSPELIKITAELKLQDREADEEIQRSKKTEKEGRKSVVGHVIHMIKS